MVLNLHDNNVVLTIWKRGTLVPVLVVGLWLLNAAISFWNAYAVGNAWVESKHAGGWRRFIAWMGAVMAASGFTWCTLILLGFGANAVGWLNDYSLDILLNAGYVIIIPPVLFAGYAIMLDSWQRAYRERTLASTAVAGYNTFASAYNTYNAVRGFGDAFSKVWGAFFSKGGKDKDSLQGAVIGFLLTVSVGFGCMLTYVIINRYAARDEPLPTARDVRRSSGIYR